jgi:lysophospholipase L1-like esterase
MLFLPLVLTISAATYSQEPKPAFFDEIRAFKLQDSINPPPARPIVFVGSSSFKLWDNIQGYFKGYQVLNRGFGGSSLPDVIRYAEDIIIPYQPKQVVIYAGENDVASGAQSEVVAARFKTLFNIIRQKLPAVPVIFVSMKPSPSREKFMPVIKQANQMIKNFLWQQPNTIYIDVFSRMLDANGKPRPELFKDDMLHMKPEGYVIWQESMQPYLQRN